MANWKAGDRVRVVTRDQTTKDAKENTYFPHLAGLEGTVAKVYSPEEVCVVIDRETLPEDNATRHAEIETRLQEKWLDSISQDARGKLSAEEQQFNLNYTVLINGADLEKPTGRKKAAPKDERPHTRDLDKTEEDYLRNRSTS